MKYICLMMIGSMGMVGPTLALISEDIVLELAYKIPILLIFAGSFVYLLQLLLRFMAKKDEAWQKALTDNTEELKRIADKIK